MRDHGGLVFALVDDEKPRRRQPAEVHPFGEVSARFCRGRVTRSKAAGQSRCPWSCRSPLLKLEVQTNKTAGDPDKL
jgi:hypothetical protein